jgi:hypothetical protein
MAATCFDYKLAFIVLYTWEKRWYKCIESKGEYFDGDWSCNSKR